LVSLTILRGSVPGIDGFGRLVQSRMNEYGLVERFFLNAARVGDQNGGTPHQIHEPV